MGARSPEGEAVQVWGMGEARGNDVHQPRVWKREVMNDDKSDIVEIRHRMGGEGEFFCDDAIRYMWSAFSGNMGASWLIPGESTTGNFAGWLLRCIQAGKVLDGRLSEPWGVSFNEIPWVDSQLEGHQ